MGLALGPPNTAVQYTVHYCMVGGGGIASGPEVHCFGRKYLSAVWGNRLGTFLTEGRVHNCPPPRSSGELTNVCFLGLRTQMSVL
jgi:hypothetical protein